jgi:hypothetical protein
LHVQLGGMKLSLYRDALHQRAQGRQTYRALPVNSDPPGSSPWSSSWPVVYNVISAILKELEDYKVARPPAQCDARALRGFDFFLTPIFSASVMSFM